MSKVRPLQSREEPRIENWRPRVLVVEDEAIVASLLAQSLEHAGYVAFIAHDALKAKGAISTFDPDAVLLDINLGSGPSGLELGNLIHRSHPNIALVFLTKYSDPRALSSTWSVPPGSSFISKDRVTDIGLLTNSLEAALRHEGIPLRDDLTAESPLHRLTRVQLEILRLAAIGLSNAAIAKRRGTQLRTVEHRLQAVYESLGIGNSPDINQRIEAIRQYITYVGMPMPEDDATI